MINGENMAMMEMVRKNVTREISSKCRTYDECFKFI